MRIKRLNKAWVIALFAAGSAWGVEPESAVIQMTAGTNSVFSGAQVQEGDAVRAGDALVTLEPIGAKEHIAAARARLHDAETVFQAARTNRLAAMQQAEKNVQSAESSALKSAEESFQRISAEYAEAMSDLNRVHRDYKPRVLYAPVSGRVLHLPVSAGSTVSGEDTVIELLPDTSAP